MVRDHTVSTDFQACATIKHAFECADRAERFIAALESEDDRGHDASKLRHDLRSALGTLRCALDVLDIAPPASSLASEAEAIALRHAAQLELKMSELGGSQWQVH